jgi:hypothetical protein
MSRIQNILVSFGAFWVSLWIAGLLAGPFGRLNDKVVYGDSVLSAIALGIMSSLSRTLAAVLAGILVTVVISSRKSELWALIVAALYVVDAPVRHHWGPPATRWDHLWQSVDLAFPAIACVVVAIITARLRRNRSNPGRVAEPSAAG